MPVSIFIILRFFFFVLFELTLKTQAFNRGGLTHLFVGFNIAHNSKKKIIISDLQICASVLPLARTLAGCYRNANKPLSLTFEHSHARACVQTESF